MTLSFVILKKFGKRIGYLAFITNWIAYEYVFMNSQIAWPWLILGNAFANNIQLIQWYEFTGHIGGTLWILLVNLVLFEIINLIKNKKSNSSLILNCSLLSLFLIVPIGYSLIRYYSYKEVGKEIDVVVVQPNIDPYNEKYNELPVEEQMTIILDLANAVADENVDYFVAPETAIPSYIWEDEIQDDNCILYMRSFLQYYPRSEFLIGASTRRLYIDGVNKTETARKRRNSGDYYDIYNTSLQIDTSQNIPLYHKSRLVPGSEIMPYPKTLGFIQDFMFDLGGMTGTCATQIERTPFKNIHNHIKVGVPICYESVFGEFLAEFSKNGANFFAIITNDGWWYNTPGYHQHNSFARLRAIESRRSIARSANTGISCFINQRGDIIKQLDWQKRDAIRSKITLNDKVTFFANYGDYIARISCYLSLLVILLLISNYFKSLFNKKKVLK
jgi:apolipoprotein N-acyltransferase